MVPFTLGISQGGYNDSTGWADDNDPLDTTNRLTTPICKSQSGAAGLMAMTLAFQASDPGSIPGPRTFALPMLITGTSQVQRPGYWLPVVPAYSDDEQRFVGVAVESRRPAHQAVVCQRKTQQAGSARSQ